LGTQATNYSGGVLCLRTPRRSHPVQNDDVNQYQGGYLGTDNERENIEQYTDK